MRIKERFKNLLQVVSGVCCASVLKCFLEFLLKVKAVSPEILNVVAGILAEIHQLSMLPAIFVMVGFTEDIAIAAPERLSL